MSILRVFGADVLSIGAEPSDIGHRSTIHDIHERRLLVSDHAQHGGGRYELHCGRPRRYLYVVYDMVLLSSVWRRTLVQWSCPEH